MSEGGGGGEGAAAAVGDSACSVRTIATAVSILEPTGGGGGGGAAAGATGSVTASASPPTSTVVVAGAVAAGAVEGGSDELVLSVPKSPNDAPPNPPAVKSVLAGKGEAPKSIGVVPPLPPPTPAPPSTLELSKLKSGGGGGCDGGEGVRACPGVKIRGAESGGRREGIATIAAAAREGREASNGGVEWIC